MVLCYLYLCLVIPICHLKLLLYASDIAPLYEEELWEMTRRNVFDGQ